MNPANLPAWNAVEVANHLWQSTAVGIAVLGLIALCGSLKARTRRTLAWIALAKFALPISLVAHWFTSISGTSERWIESNVLVLPAMLVPARFATAPEMSFNFISLVIAIWATVGVALFASWIIRGQRLRRRLLADAVPISNVLMRHVEIATEQVGLKRRPRCVAVENECGPGALGIFSTVLILPRGIEQTLSPAELESVLIHELIHLHRRDNLWSALQALIGSALWFNPVVWILNRRINLETEQACDESVLEITGDADAYAQGIVKAVRHALGMAQPGLIGIGTPPVVTRIKHILAHGTRTDRPLARGVALASAGLFVVLSGHAGSFSRVAQDIAPMPAPRPALTVVPPPAMPASVAKIEPRMPEPVATKLETAVEVEAPAPVPVAAADPVAKVEATPEPRPQPTVSEPAPASVPTPAAESTPPPVVAQPISASAPPPSAATVTTKPTYKRGIEIYDISKLDQVPVAKFMARPQYPKEMRLKNLDGEVVVDFVVNTDGNTENVYPVRTTDDRFAGAAVEAVKKWKFKPGKKGGRAVHTHMQVPIVFTLREG